MRFTSDDLLSIPTFRVVTLADSMEQKMGREPLFMPLVITHYRKYSRLHCLSLAMSRRRFWRVEDFDISSGVMGVHSARSVTLCVKTG